MAAGILFDTIMVLGARWGGPAAEVSESGVHGTFRVRRNGVTVFVDATTVPHGQVQLWHRSGARVVEVVVGTANEAADFIERALGVGNDNDRASRATGGRTC